MLGNHALSEVPISTLPGAAAPAGGGGEGELFTEQPSDSVAVSDSLRFVHNRVFPDDLSLQDEFRKQLTKRSGDDLTLADSVSLLLRRDAALADVQDIADSLSILLNRSVPLSDIQDISDQIRALHVRRFGDDLSIVDSASISKTGIQQLALGDTLDVSDETRKQITKRITETLDLSDAVTTTAFRGLTTLSISERQDILDATRATHHRFFPDDFSLSDQATVSRPLRVVAPTEQVDVTDAVFLQQLLDTLRVTDEQTFTDEVTLELLRRELAFFDSLPVQDDATVTRFADELEVLMAGIRTFTCTPGFTILREAMTKTSVVEFDNSGLFALFGRSSRPTYRFRIPLVALTKHQCDSLSAFHHFHQGAKPFFWDGGYYGYISSLQLVGEGNGSKTDYFLPNRFIDANSITVGIYNGTTTSITTAFSLYADQGMISFATAPTSGHDVMASHAHKYKVVFEPDGLKVEEFYSGIFRAEIVLRETLL
jgi:hypothetical protein